MSTLGSVLVALLVPLGWGLLSAWGFDRLMARRKTRCIEDESQQEPAS